MGIFFGRVRMMLSKECKRKKKPAKGRKFLRIKNIKNCNGIGNTEALYKISKERT